MSASRFFVTGTDTGAGKTVVCAALAAAFAERGQPPLVRKPVLSGAPDNPVDPPLPHDLAGLPDDRLLWEASGRVGPLGAVCSLRHTQPIAPSVAREREQPARSYGEIVRRLREELSATSGPVLVEGVGGWRVWLDADHSVGDLAGSLALPVLVVAGNRLGAINHSVLTVESIVGGGHRVAGLVLNSGAHGPDPEETMARATNLGELRKRLSVPVVEFPALDGLTQIGLARAGERLLSSLDDGDPR